MQLVFIALSLFKQFNALKACVLLSVAGLLITGCGKRKPPLPPVERIVQRAEISGIQQGDQVILQWTLGGRNAPATDLVNISRIDVYRLAEKTTDPAGLTEEDFSSRATLIATIPVTTDDFKRREMSFPDRLNFVGQAARLRYAVRYVNAAGQKASFSNYVVLEPTAKVAVPPTGLQTIASQSAVELVWTRPPQNIDQSTPANIAGYNIFRVDGDGEAKRINRQPVTNESFRDGTFTFGNRYRYFVRTVSLGGDGRTVESSDSNMTEIIPRDTFAPAAPTALTIAAAPTAISIFFASNIEADIAGYKIYRSTDRSLPLTEWKLLTPQPVTANTFQDADVVSGTTYFYYVVALDRAGNVSPQSDVVGDRVP